MLWYIGEVFSHLFQMSILKIHLTQLNGFHTLWYVSTVTYFVCTFLIVNFFHIALWMCSIWELFLVLFCCLDLFCQSQCALFCVVNVVAIVGWREESLFLHPLVWRDCGFWLIQPFSVFFCTVFFIHYCMRVD
jgi:hypothetical protein